MRKACADLLRYRGLNTEKRHSEHREPGGGGPRARGYHPDSITPAFEAEVLEALERLGQEDEEADGEKEYPQITQIAQMRGGGFKRKSGNGNGNGDGDENQYEPRASGEPPSPPRRMSGSVPPESHPPQEMTIRTGRMTVPPLEEAASRGCHGQVPPTRDVCGVASLSSSPHGQAPKTPHAHTTRDPLHQPRPPPRIDL